MVEFKIQLEDSLVQAIGHSQIQTYLQEVVKKMLLKTAVQDILEDLKSNDFQNDSDFINAKHLAWQQEKHKYIVVK